MKRRVQAADEALVKRPVLIALCTALISLPDHADGSGVERHAPQLVPAPRSVTMGAGEALLSPRWTLVVQDTASDAYAAELLAGELEARFGWRPSARSASAASPSIVLSTASVQAGAFPRQAYGISITPDRITIRAATPEGRFYGVQTLRQLVRSSAGPRLPCLEIVDWPAMAWRGVSDDVSRGQMSRLRDLRELMGELAYYKINLYGIYLEDVVTARPDSTRGITASDLTALAAEARRNHIRLLPIFQTMGWNGGIVRALERQPPAWMWSHLPRGTPPSPFSPGATRSILRDVDTIAAAVPSPWFHLGGDEVGTFGLTHPEAHAVLPDGATHGAYVRFLSDHLLREHGQRTFVYSHFLLKFPRLIDQLDRATGIVDWNYDPNATYPTARRFIAAGFRNVFVSPGLWSWNAFYPNYERGLANAQAFIDTGKAAGAVGAITSAWGDNASLCLRENNRLGYAYGGAAAWQRDSPPIEPFFDDFARVEYGAQGPGLARASRLVGLRTLNGVDYVGRAYHRAPRVHRAGSARRAEMAALRSDMQEAIRLIDAEAPHARRGQDHLRALRLAATQFLYLADRELTMDAIAGILEVGAPDAQPRAARLLDTLAQQLAELSREYEALWLARNKRDALDSNLAKLALQSKEIDALRLAARSGKLSAWSPGQRPLAQSVDGSGQP